MSTVQTVETTLPPLRLLVVEDMAANRKVLSMFLKDTPVTCEMAEDGRQALDKYMAGTFDAVLMDVEMPVLDGHEATRAIRAWEKANHHPATPIIAVTAHAFEEQR